MPIGIGAGLAISAAATAGGGITAGVIQSKAAKGANKVTADYNAKALAAAQEEQAYQRQQDEYKNKVAADQRAYQRQQYANYSTGLQPFVDAGTTATKDAQTFLNTSPYASRPSGFPTAPAPTSYTGGPPPPVPGTTASQTVAQAAQAAGGGTLGPGVAATPQSVAQAAQAVGGGTRAPGMATYDPSGPPRLTTLPAPMPPTAGEGMIFVRSPKGTVRSVPAWQLKHYTDAGATQVGAPA